jgi:hypothetical protein
VLLKKALLPLRFCILPSSAKLGCVWKLGPQLVGIFPPARLLTRPHLSRRALEAALSLAVCPGVRTVVIAPLSNRFQRLLGSNGRTRAPARLNPIPGRLLLSVAKVHKAVRRSVMLAEQKQGGALQASKSTHQFAIM